MKLHKTVAAYFDDRTGEEIRGGGWVLSRMGSITQREHHFRGLASLFVLLRDNPEHFNISRETWDMLVSEREQQLGTDTTERRAA